MQGNRFWARETAMGFEMSRIIGEDGNRRYFVLFMFLFRAAETPKAIALIAMQEVLLARLAICIVGTRLRVDCRRTAGCRRSREDPRRRLTRAAPSANPLG